MARRIPAFCLLSVLGVAAAVAGPAVDDDVGARVELGRPAARVVSLAPHLTEALFAIGAGDRLVGADQRSDFPAAARDLPRIGEAGRIDLERILALRPDLVLAWDSGNPRAQVEALARLGLPVYRSEPRQPSDIAGTLRRLGRLTGRTAQAERLAGTLAARIEQLRRRYARAAPVRYFYQVWHRPLITLNGEHLVSRGLALCGGRNVFADLHGLAPQVTVEAVLSADPQLIVASGEAGERPAWLDQWRRWPGLSAAAGDHLRALHPDLVFRPSPRFVDGLERLCEWLQVVREDQAGR